MKTKWTNQSIKDEFTKYGYIDHYVDANNGFIVVEATKANSVNPFMLTTWTGNDGRRGFLIPKEDFDNSKN